MNIITNQEKLRKPLLPYDVRESINIRLLCETANLLLLEMKNNNGQGLAANQLGLDIKMFVMKRERYSPICLVNPIITKQLRSQKGIEGCLSVPGVQKLVTRPYKVKVKGYNQYLTPVSYSFTDIEARRACHEIDHLNGKLIIDYE